MTPPHLLPTLETNQVFGLSHWEATRLAWTAGHRSYDPELDISQYKQHPELSDIEPEHFDAIFNSLVQTQVRYSQ